MDIFALIGFFSLVMFGAAYFMVPRVTGRDWLSSRLITLHFLFSVYGMITVFLVTLLGGLQQGLGQEDWRQPWMVAVSGTNPYAVATTFAWCLILFSNVFFFLHLILMWLRVGRHAFLPAQPGSAHGSIPDDEADASDHAAPHHATAHSH
jgi:cytochrome c oxidase cbb3-type subunit 1